MSFGKHGTERRAFGRRHTNDHAIVRIPGRPPFRCVVLNMSEAGAMLDFGAEVWLPYNFKLVWETGGREEECEIRHRNGGYVGVFFQKNVEVVPAPRQMLKSEDVAPWMPSNSTNRR